MRSSLSEATRSSAGDCPGCFGTQDSSGCKPSQAIVKNLGEKVNANVPQRYKAFENLESHLDTLITKLGTTSVDLTKLKEEQAMLKTKIATFKTDYEAYKATLTDLRSVDCSTDTTGFKAALEDARTARQKLSDELADMKAYIKDTIKPTIVEIRQQVAKLNAGTATESKDTNSGESQ